MGVLQTATEESMQTDARRFKFGLRLEVDAYRFQVRCVERVYTSDAPHKISKSSTCRASETAARDNVDAARK